MKCLVLHFITFDGNSHGNHRLGVHKLCCLQDGKNLLHHACVGGNLDIIIRAVGLGLDVNSTDKVCCYLTSEV